METAHSAIEQAEAWFARLMAPDCTDDEREAFLRWRQAPGNARAYAATEALWAGLDGLEDDDVIGPHAAAALLPEPEPLDEWTAAVGQRRRTAPAPRPRRWTLPLAIAASVLVTVLGLYLAAPLLQVQPQHYAATLEPSTVTLADGSRVRLDLATDIEVRMRRRSRDVRLLQGRAVFDVVHDAARPFVVDAGHGRVSVHGTRFQIDREDDQLVVTLVEGAVSVAAQGSGGNSGPLRLAPGQQARYSPRPGTGWTLRDVDAAAATSWSQGFHVFSATPLAEAVREINRYSPVKLRLQDPSLETLALSGNFRIGDAGTIAIALPVVLPVTATRTADGIVLARRH